MTHRGASEGLFFQTIKTAVTDVNWLLERTLREGLWQKHQQSFPSVPTSWHAVLAGSFVDSGLLWLVVQPFNCTQWLFCSCPLALTPEMKQRSRLILKFESWGVCSCVHVCICECELGESDKIRVTRVRESVFTCVCVFVCVFSGWGVLHWVIRKNTWILLLWICVVTCG